MNTNNPFIHTFRVDDRDFMYDVGTNHVMEVNAVTREVIGSLGRLSSSEMVGSLQDRFVPAQIRSSLRSVREMQRKYGLFSDKRPEIVRDLMDPEAIWAAIEGNMQQVILEPTQACNLRCVYCLYSAHYPYTRSHSNHRMSLQTAQKAIALLAAHSGKGYRPAISFFGGEPMLAFDLMTECVRYAKTLRWHEPPRFLVSTNGTLLTHEVIEFLVTEDVELGVSLDGPRAIHDRYRRWPNGKGTYDVVVNALRRIRRRDARYYLDRVSFNITGAPPVDLEEIAYFLATSDLVGPAFMYSPISTAYTTMFDGIPQEELEGTHRQYEALREEYVQAVSSGELGSGDVPEYRLHKSLFQKRVCQFHRRQVYSGLPDACDVSGRCIPGQRRLFVTADGSLWPCERVDVGLPGLRIGHMNTGLDMKRILSLGEELISITTEDCKDCFALRNCDQCFSTLSSGPDGIGRPWKSKCCEDTRRLFDETLRTYCSITMQNPKALDFARDIQFA